MQSRMSSCRSSANDFDATEHETPAESSSAFRYFFTTTISGLSLAALLWSTRALTLALVRAWPILDRRQRPIAQRPLHAALNRLMVNPNSLPHRTERRILAIGQQHLRPRYPARRLGSRPRKSRQSFNLFAAHCQFDCSPPSCHDAAPRFANRKTRNPPSTHRFHDAGFMESIV